MTHHVSTIASVLVFMATYVVMAIGKVPFYRIDRAGAALLGGMMMLVLGVLSTEEAYRAINFDTITLLLGMMIVVANLGAAGFFRIVNDWIAKYVHHPITLLLAVVLGSGVLSAFLVNDTVCLMMAPLVLDLVTRLKRDPVPYLLGIAMSSNVGSVATVTGNPQNMIISSMTPISYGAFTATFAPVALVGLIVATILIVLAHRSEFFTRERLPRTTVPAHAHGPLLLKTVLVLAVMIALFFLGQPEAKVAIIGGAFLLLTRHVKPEKIYRQIDWPLLIMFVGLFLVVAGFQKTVFTPEMVAAVGRLRLDNVAVLSGVTAVLSNLVSNVPAVLVLKPFISALADPQRAWLVVAMASTLAGNFTLAGSVANLIVVQQAKARGVEIDFWNYFKVGAPLSLVTILIGALWV